MVRLVFAHGWGHDRHLWDGVIARLPTTHTVETVDFGFFGEPRMVATTKVGVTAGNPRGTGSTESPDEAGVIAIGHSLGGLWWLAQSPLPWQRLLLINGFPRFTESSDYAPAVAPRLLARMRSRFAQAPDEVLADFHARCGARPGSSTANAPDHARLGEGLGWLADWDGRASLAARASDVFALAASDDPIVPRATSAMAFAALPSSNVSWCATDSHVLPLSHPDICAQWIAQCLP